MVAQKDHQRLCTAVDSLVDVRYERFFVFEIDRSDPWVEACRR